MRVVAAEALGRYGTDDDARDSVAVLLPAADLSKSSLYLSLLALNALDALDDRAHFVRSKIAALPQTADVPRQLNGYVPRLVDKVLADLE